MQKQKRQFPFCKRQVTGHGRKREFEVLGSPGGLHDPADSVVRNIAKALDPATVPSFVREVSQEVLESLKGPLDSATRARRKLLKKRMALLCKNRLVHGCRPCVLCSQFEHALGCLLEEKPELPLVRSGACLHCHGYWETSHRGRKYWRGPDYVSKLNSQVRDGYTAMTNWRAPNPREK